MLFSWKLISILSYFGTQALSNPIRDQPNLEKANSHNHHIARPLRAIKKSRDYQSRIVGNVFTPRAILELDYIDQDSLDRDAPFVATMTIEPKRPAMVLEDIEDYLDYVRCSRSGIAIKFKSSQLSARAQKAWTMPDFMVITSHQGCSQDGERAPYLVSGVVFDTQRATAVLSAKYLGWAKSYITLGLEFGTSNSYCGLDFEGSPSYPLLSKRASPKDVSFDLTGYRLDIEGIDTTCTSCVGSGTITVSNGGFLLKDLSDNLESIPKTGAAAFELAGVNIVLDNFAASFQLTTEVNVDQTFTFHLLGDAGVALSGFSIPGVASIGPTFDPQIVATFDVVDVISFTYGFDMRVPDGAELKIDISDAFSSSESGFDATTFTALPFEVLDPQIGLNFSVAFRPVVELGLTVLDASFDPVTVFADIPKYEGSLLLLDDQGTICAPSGDEGYLLYSADFEFDLGVGASVDFEKLGIDINPSLTLVSTRVLPTSSCIALGGGAPAATPTTPVIVSTISGAPGPTISGASAYTNNGTFYSVPTLTSPTLVLPTAVSAS